MERDLESALKQHKQRILDFYDYLKSINHDDDLCSVLFKNGYSMEKLIELRILVSYLEGMITK